MKVCKVDGCNTKCKGLGFCNRHYLQYKKYGFIKHGALGKRNCLNPECGNEFQPREETTKYCKLDCKTRHYWLEGKTHEIMNRFNKSEKGRERSRRFDKKEHRLAYKRLTSATNRKYKDMELKCTISGCTNKDIHKHHEDYSKPYEIIPLCRFHHLGYHNGRLAI